MGFRRGLVLGLGIGYVLGARAGRERYEELKRVWHEISGNPTVQRVMASGRDRVSTGARRGLEVVQEGVDKATTKVKRRMEGEHPGAGATST